MSRRAPRPLAAALAQLQRELAPAGLLARVQLVWEEAVGTGIASQARPTGERDGVLTVTCATSVWAHELTMSAADLLDRLNLALASGPATPGAGEARPPGAPALVELRCRTR